MMGNLPGLTSRAEASKDVQEDAKFDYFLWDKETKYFPSWRVTEGSANVWQEDGVLYFDVSESPATMQFEIPFVGEALGLDVSEKSMIQRDYDFRKHKEMDEEPQVTLFFKKQNELKSTVIAKLGGEKIPNEKLAMAYGVYIFGLEVNFLLKVEISQLIVHTTVPKPKALEIPLINVCKLPVGSLVSTTGGDYEFLGFELEPTPKMKRPIAVLKNSSGDFLRVVLDPRIYRCKSIRQVETPITTNATVQMLIGKLRIKCSQQLLRGVPLIQLFNYLSFDCDLEVAIVGGAIRDLLRNISLTEIQDIDIAVGGCDYFSLWTHILDFYAKRGMPLNEAVVRAEGTSKKFGMLKVIHDPSTDVDDLDIGILKAQLIPDLNGCQGEYLYGFSWCHDASMRDYTINAIYVDVCRGRVFDPTQALEKDHKLEDSGKVAHTLRSAALSIYQEKDLTARKIIEQDVGGQFRFFKELNKSCQKFTVTAETDTEVEVCRALLSAPVSELWVCKLVKKLFGTAKSQGQIEESVQLLHSTLCRQEEKDEFKKIWQKIKQVAGNVIGHVKSSKATMNSQLDDATSGDIEHEGMYLDLSSAKDQKIFKVLSAIEEHKP